MRMTSGAETLGTIPVYPSPTADTRTCDVTTVPLRELRRSSELHINDVQNALGFFQRLIGIAGEQHDLDKLSDIESFYADFQTKFERTEWWDRHRKLNRHHLVAMNGEVTVDGVPEDVNLIDVLDYIADCVMAGKARSGTVQPLVVPAWLLQRAFENTVQLLTEKVVVRS